MASRLPKPTGLPFLKSNGTGQLSLPPNMGIHATRSRTGLNLKKFDCENLKFERKIGSPENNKLGGAIKRAMSPDGGYKPLQLNNARTKLRRSRSACDLRENSSRPLFKRPEPTLAPIPSKMSKPTTSVVNPITTSRAVMTIKKSVPIKKMAEPSKAIKPTASSTSITQTKSISKRIPPYDYKARFNDLLEKHKILKEKFEKLKEEIGILDTLPDLYEESQTKLHQTEEELKICKTDNKCLKEQNHMQHNKIQSLTYSLKNTQENLKKYTEQCEQLTTENQQFSLKINTLEISNKSLSEENEILSTEMEMCKEQLFKANYERKELHNVVMDLRGNIRVFCRVRPPLHSEKERLLFKVNYLDECSLEISSNDGSNKITKHDFNFDQVFHHKSGQEDIFEMVSPLIQSALDGYNVCIFAYGQTGSGKTYTMDGTVDSLGIVPRTVDLLFDSVKNYKRIGWEYEMRVTFLEIYNETLYDLLNANNRDLEIRMANARSKTEIYVSNLTEEIVEDGDHLRSLMEIARSNRATAATVGNERSSRSHAVTRIQLIGRHEEKQETSIGSINLVDLAGSESPKTSNRMDETKNINRSLSELTNVVLALLQKQEHIPYRNSKLTHLLMPCLGGNSKTLMFINISPFQDCFVESVKSLRFAASVNSCKLNKVKKNKGVLNSSLI